MKTADQKTSSLVSVVIPCYNAEAYVGEAIESALGQSHEPVEVIVVDDGSTDRSLDVIQSFGDQITWRTGENRGACHARNRGLALASGAFVKFLDADDLLLENAIATQMEQMSTIADEREIVYGDKLYIDADGNFLERMNYRRLRQGEEPVEYMVKSGNNPQTSLPLHRRKCLLEVGGFDESLAHTQEYDLHVRLVLAGVRFCYIPTETSLIRRHEGKERITNQDHFQDDPEGRLRRLRKLEHLIREKREEGASEPIRKSLSRDAWHGGRAALRNSRPEVAKKYFDYARSLHPQCVAGASPAYRWSVRLFGPTFAEEVGAWARDLKSGLRH